ncbi:hypothetical protein [Reyranella sp. CPCC 100927]|uniref:hypothetical protein n=1 Tax=Reyranella sp. CPCC 100927 TaxID=2599616 RepID=UPI0011B360D5|nr:hypothetical protein [Reyranella sp. CPCC 100927]TWS96840.1 hypothetical protein FQU96_38480 [Reyranella sp. CPCC 100927]
MTTSIMARGDAYATLRALLAREANQTVSAAARAMSDAIVARHKSCLLATLFYGSCLRPADDGDGTVVGPGRAEERLMDFYAVVDDVRRANTGALAALGNRFLPPNVFYLEVPYDGTRVRCKYAIVTLAQFRRLVKEDTLQNYFWGRFCQPTAVPFARSGMRDALVESLADAVTTAVKTTAPLFATSFSARDLWVRVFSESYGAELRPESAERPAHVHDAHAARYTELTPAALAAAGFPSVSDADGRFAPVAGADVQRRTRRAWIRRRWLGKTLNILRLMKAVFTFEGGADYVAWKIQRHSGVRVDMSDWQRRHPLLASPVLAVRYWRKGAFR